MEQSKLDIRRLREDKYHIYKFAKSESNVNQIILGEDGIINIHAPNGALRIHEIRHISYCLDKHFGQLFFNSENKFKSVDPHGYKDELYAHRAQYSFSPNTMPGGNVKDISKINLNYIHDLSDENGNLLYQGIDDLYKIVKKN